MRSVAYAALVLVVAAAPVSAQVINGESTYGDSSLHQPPSDDATPDGNARNDGGAQDRNERQDRSRR